MKMIKLLVLFLSLAAANSFAESTSPTSVLIKVYGVAVSTSADCSSPVSIFSSDSGSQVDFVNNPVLGGGDIADGTYRCVMITMSDIITATPLATAGTCTAGVPVTGEVCQNTESTDLLSGSSTSHINCVTGEDRVTLFLDTGTTRVNGGGAFRKPTSTADATNGYKLSSPFVVSGTSSGTFVADFTGQMDGSGGSCGLQPPAFGFR
jgi:hypothetical protein